MVSIKFSRLLKYRRQYQTSLPTSIRSSFTMFEPIARLMGSMSHLHIALHGRRTTQSSPFCSLPPEMLDAITDYLPSSSILALSYTCRYFASYLRSTALMSGSRRKPERPYLRARVQDRYSQPRVSLYSVLQDPYGKNDFPYFLNQTRTYDSLKLLFLLDRDGLWPGKAACSWCCTVHSVDTFSPQSLENVSTRNCMGTNGFVEICPHMRLRYGSLLAVCNSHKAWEKIIRKNEHDTQRYQSHHIQTKERIPKEYQKRLTPAELEAAEAKTLERSEARSREQKQAFENEKRQYTDKITESCNQCTYPVSITTWATSKVIFPIIFQSQLDEPDEIRSQVATALKNSRKSICPHLPLSHPSVLGAYDPTCNSFERFKVKTLMGIECRCRNCSGLADNECRVCHAEFKFVLTDYGRRDALQIVAERSFDPTCGPFDPKWINQLVDT